MAAIVPPPGFDALPQTMSPHSKHLSWRTESSKLIQLASPILIGQLAQIGMGVTDTIMAGRYGANDLAAIAIGQSLWLPVFMFFIGLFAASTTLIAHHCGAKNLTGVRDITQQSICLALLGSPLAIILLLQAQAAFVAMGIEEDVTTIANNYLHYLAYGLPAAVCFLTLRSFCEGMKLTRPIMLINLFALACNIPLNYLFIYGKLGFPEMGGAGCGLASALVMWIQLLAALIMATQIPSLKRVALLSSPWWLHWQTIKPILSLGLPIALSTVAEVSLFAVMALLLAPLGAEVIAGHQIALSVSSVTFMLPLSMGMAITIQSGHYLGADQQQRARLSSVIGIVICCALALLSMSTILAYKESIASLYSRDIAIQNIAVSLLFFTAIYQLPDAIQIGSASALRGYCDTRVPLLIILFSYWVISVPVGWSLIYGLDTLWVFENIGFDGLGARGMWIGLVCGLSCAALLQSWRLWHLVLQQR